jgi:hypothetical protein
MATTTPNFGWSVPTSTDLVKDGATAIETLGDAIDASLVDLKGGTTGQLLAKNSGTDMDFTWTTPAASPFVGCAASGAPSIPNAVYTAAEMAYEDIDTNGFHSTTTNTSRITIPTGKGGKYLVIMKTDGPTLATIKVSRIYKNGVQLTDAASRNYNSNLNIEGNATQCYSAILALSAGDYIEQFIYQNTGSSQTIGVYCQVQFLGA